MSKNKKYNNIDPEDFLRYINGEMSDEERHAMEREIQKDPFAADALEGISIPGAELAREDLSRLQRRLQKRISGTRSMLWVRVAASIAVLLTIGTLYFTIFSDKLGRLDRKVADTESAEPARDKSIPEDLEILTEEAKEEAKEEADALMERAGGQEPDRIAEPEQSEVYILADEQEEFETGLVIGEEIIIAEEERELKDTLFLMSAEVAVEQDAVGTENMADLLPPDEEISVEKSVAGPPATAQARQSSIQQTEAMDEKQPEEIAGMDAAKSKRSEPLTIMPDMDAPAAIMLSDTILATPVGGEELFDRYIAENIRFPEGDTILASGRVALIFNIDPQGRPRIIEVKDSPGDAFSREAVRLLQEGPNWIPVLINGIPTEEKARVTIEFIREKPE